MGHCYDLDEFYQHLRRLERRVGGARRLAECTGRQPWPQRGVYFFFEDGEVREDGLTPRVVRVGTHALRAGSQTTLWRRLAQHRGTRPSTDPGGNHRSSVFRHHVGLALLNRGLHPEAASSWNSNRPAREERGREANLEATVSKTIGAMRVLWVAVEDDPGPDSLRGRIEADAIGLLSAATAGPVDPASQSWLGHAARGELIRTSGLWNVNHVHKPYRRSGLDALAEAVGRTPRPPT